ncbi:helix-turn-helix protein [Rubripirellula lacrimiformis]|uniref:Helix-turn-helix protein n=1 Tax=Rubripirellula lacrimiformis TaxID=1930273 RepID=A0A517NB28_9BACT|nr:helix-turn-helix transcriptional regulator [Rubripirellula lacrimiformis]QDT04346.1 helix-turn-helix protein [Rubripirellula lacrimiformis]
MAKKKATKKRAAKSPAKVKAKAKSGSKGVGKRSTTIDPAQFGISVSAILRQIKPHLADKTQAEIAKALGTSPMVISHYFTGHRDPSIGALAALADLAGGSLSLDFHPPGSDRKGGGLNGLDPAIKNYYRATGIRSRL